MTNRWLPFPPFSPRPAPGTIEVAVRGRPVAIRVRRNARARRYTLRLSADGASATVTVPARTSLRDLRAFVDRHVPWLEARMAAEPPATLASGSLVPVRGVPHRVSCTGAARGHVRVAKGVDGVPELVVPGDEAHLRRRVETYLRGVARSDLGAAVARHAAALGVVPRAVRLKDTTSRWGSASSTGTLSFSWRLAMAPPFVLDYLAAHEVAHLREMNHSDRFWAICRSLAPRSEEARAWLKANGRDLHAVP